MVSGAPRCRRLDEAHRFQGRARRSDLVGTQQEIDVPHRPQMRLGIVAGGEGDTLQRNRAYARGREALDDDSNVFTLRRSQRPRGELGAVQSRGRTGVGLAGIRRKEAVRQRSQPDRHQPFGLGLVDPRLLGKPSHGRLRGGSEDAREEGGAVGGSGHRGKACGIGAGYAVYPTLDRRDTRAVDGPP